MFLTYVTCEFLYAFLHDVDSILFGITPFRARSRNGRIPGWSVTIEWAGGGTNLGFSCGSGSWGAVMDWCNTFCSRASANGEGGEYRLILKPNLFGEARLRFMPLIAAAKHTKHTFFKIIPINSEDVSYLLPFLNNFFVSQTFLMHIFLLYLLTIC